MTKLKNILYRVYGTKKMISIHFVFDLAFLAAKAKEETLCQFTVPNIKMIIKMG